MFATGVTMDLAEWIIDDICLVVYMFVSKAEKFYQENRKV